jgi:hypothetical protein
LVNKPPLFVRSLLVMAIATAVSSAPLSGERGAKPHSEGG